MRFSAAIFRLLARTPHGQWEAVWLLTAYRRAGGTWAALRSGGRVSA